MEVEDAPRLGPGLLRSVSVLQRSRQCLIGSKPEEFWLFPELAANLTKRWATYLKTSGLYRRWEGGHALRHTFNDTLLRAGVPDALVRN